MKLNNERAGGLLGGFIISYFILVFSLIFTTARTRAQTIDPQPGSVGSADQHDNDEKLPSELKKNCVSCEKWLAQLNALLTDGLFSVRYRSQFNAKGESVRNQAQYRGNFKFRYDIPGTKDRFSIKFDAMTGSRVDSDWIDSFGQDEGLRRSFSLRNLYLHMEPFQTESKTSSIRQISIDIGFMPINPAKIRGDAVLSPDRQVSFDGIRFNLSIKHPWIREVAIQTGAVKQLSNFNFWERGTNLTQPNTLQIFIRGDMNRFLTHVQEYSRIGNLSMVRSMLEIVPLDSIKAIDRIVFEYLVSNTARSTQGYSAQIIKNIGHLSAWFAFSRRFPETLGLNDGQIPRENLFRTTGPLFSGYLRWKQSKYVQPYVRFHKGIGQNQDIFDFPSVRTGFFARPSLRWEMGFRFPLP